MSPAPEAPYETLASIIERELTLVAERSFDELQELKVLRSELENALPTIPPAAARPALERCRMLQKRVEIELLRVREALLLELERVRHAQRTADGYAPARRHGARVVVSA
jgi:hypothetical protein